MEQPPLALLLDAALPHIVFDGWSDKTLRAAAKDCGVPYGLARALFPRGGVDMALAFHKRGDDEMRAALEASDLGAMRYRDRVAYALRLRLENIADKEAVRRGAALFALPQYSADGARAIWGTADAIWTALGDSSTDVNWYSKRATLSAVYSACLLYWLGDDSDAHHESWNFIDRRIDDVMQIETIKARLRANPVSKALLSGPMKILGNLRAPRTAHDLPGSLRRPF